MRTPFDSYAAAYDATLNRALALSGESAAYFARERVTWLAAELRRRSRRVFSVLDFGCGTGSTTPFLLEHLGAERVLGVDASRESIDRARERYGSGRAEFSPLESYEPAGTFDLAYCNGVFHHIPVGERAAALAFVRNSLRPGGLFSLWENNPWNPGTRLIMSRCEFDAGALPLSASAAREFLRAAGFHVQQTDFLFVFPRWLRALRVIEPALSALPLGAQYHLLCEVAATAEVSR
ncbi:MAG: class I SAM-dependent methyltransferase [Chthoniobacterales bacterium]